MVKQVIAVLVGAVLLFLWQFLSWSMLQVHQTEFGYTANQDQIMACLGQHLTEEGTYMIPMVPPGTPMDQEQKMMEASIGKPWASISYHKSFDMSMGMNMARGFIVDIVAVFLLVWILGGISNRSLSNCLQISVAIGFISYLTIPYSNSIWFETKSIGYLIDAVVSWSLVGAWLGWYLNRP